MATGLTASQQAEAERERRVAEERRRIAAADQGDGRGRRDGEPIDGLAIVAIDRIHPGEDNVRRDVGDVEELAASLRSVGLLQPLVVTPWDFGDGYVVVCGHRRLAAARVAELTELPVIIREMTNAERLEAMLVENAQRTDLTPIEEAQAYQQLLGLEFTQETLATRIGRSQSHVSKRLALLKLPNRIQEAVYSGGISVADALLLTQITDMPDVLDEAFDNREHWGGIPRYVKDAVEERTRREKVAKAEAEAEAKGLKVVKMPNFGAKEKRIGKAYGDLTHITAKAHSKEKCHAVAIGHNGDLVAICTKPGNHPKPKDDAGANQGVQRLSHEERRAQREAEAAAKEARGVFLVEQVPRLKEDQLVRIAATSIIAAIGRDFGDSRSACRLLGIDPVGTGWSAGDAALTAEADKSGLYLWRVACALGLTELEQSTVEYQYEGDPGPAAVLYDQVLAQLGWTGPSVLAAPEPAAGDNADDDGQPALADAQEDDE
ncbi:MAG: ParB/RepB/Spo0J family partition protein [Candidatus Dormibacteria bacterium]